MRCARSLDRISRGDGDDAVGDSDGSSQLLPQDMDAALEELFYCMIGVYSNTSRN